MNKLSKILIISENTLESNDLKKIFFNEFSMEVIIDKDINEKVFSNELNIILLNLLDNKRTELILEKLSNLNYQFFLIIISDKKKTPFKSKVKFRFIETPFLVSDLLNSISFFIDKPSQTSFGFKIKHFTYSQESLTLYNTQSKDIIRLTEMENKFISFLIKSRLPVSKSEIMSNVWGHKNNLETHTLESLVYRLRLKVELNPKKPDIIKLKDKKYFLST